MPFAGYPDFAACVADKQGKADDPEVLCAWLEHETTGKWPGEMTEGLPATAKDKYWQAFEVAMSAEKNEAKAVDLAGKAIADLGWIKQKHGWTRKAEHKLAVRDVYGVPVFATGEHNGDKYTAQDLKDMVAAFSELKGKLDPPVKIGHTSDEFNKRLAKRMGVDDELLKGEDGNGVMALGWIGSLRVSGDVMYADLIDVPEPVAELIESKSYNKVSAEVLFNFKEGDKTYPKVMCGLALLGAELPAVRETGLETAAVYMVAAKPDSIIEFALDIEEVTYEQLQPALADVDKAIDTAMKGRSGVGIIRAMWKELQQKVSKMLEKKQTISMFQATPEVIMALKDNWDGFLSLVTDILKSSDDKVTKKRKLEDATYELSNVIRQTPAWNIEKSKEEEGMNEEMLKLLGLDEKAKDEDVSAAIKKLQSDDLGPIKSALGLPPEATVEECVAKIKEMMGAMQGGGAEMKKFSDRVAALEKTNKNLQRENRKAHYKEIAVDLSAISGKPDEIAEELVKLEEAAGEDVAKVVLGRYQDQNKRLIAAGIFKAKGTPAAGDEDDSHDFIKEVKKYMEEKSVDEPVAMAAIRKSHSKLFKDFMAKRRVVPQAS